VFDFLHRFPNLKTIIINGGDPLCMPPKYYWDIIDFLDKNKYPANLSFTSNLWDFYKRPEKWIDLFKNERVGVNTSFQYDIPGQGRLKPDFTNYSEEDFWKISDMMLDKIGYRPDFISVIGDDNKHLAIKNVELAYKMSNGNIPTSHSSDKKLGVQCKLNYVMKSGPIKNYKTRDGEEIIQGAEESNFIMADIYRIYVDIYNANLGPWEHSTLEMAKIIKDSGSTTVCPLNRKCDYGIRVLQPTTSPKGKESIEQQYYSCGAFGDDLDKVSAIDFNKEIYNKEFFTPLQNAIHLDTLKKSCYGCPMFQICCGCKKTVSDYRKKGQESIEEHCQKMKKLAPEILRINKFSEEEIKLMITPYKSEM